MQPSISVRKPIIGSPSPKNDDSDNFDISYVLFCRQEMFLFSWLTNFNEHIEVIIYDDQKKNEIGNIIFKGNLI